MAAQRRETGIHTEKHAAAGVFVGHPFHVMQGFFHLAQMVVDDGPVKMNDRRRARRRELQQLEALLPLWLTRESGMSGDSKILKRGENSITNHSSLNP
jgi:hypothetical protein